MIILVHIVPVYEKRIKAKRKKRRKKAAGSGSS